MSVFREHKTSADRSAQDRRRHREKIEKALKDGIHDVVAEESIIGHDGKTKIRIPVKGIKEYRFVYGDNENNKKTGSAPGADKHKGQIVGKGPPDQQGSGNKAGNEEGTESYEVEISLDELASYLFDDLNLPSLEKKKFKEILEKKLKRSGYRNQGIKPRLDKKETLKRKIRRKLIVSGSNEDLDEEEEEITLNERDLRYRHVDHKIKENTNAVVFFVMDVSGSMSKDKKYLAKSFYFLLYQFLRYKYDKIEIVFIAHSTIAKEVTEKQFFTHDADGGTMISPALEMVKDIVTTRYHPSTWNVYAFHCSDGDNWPEDVERAVKSSQSLKNICQMYCYCEIIPADEEANWQKGKDTTMMELYKAISDSKFKVVKVNRKEDVWPGFRQIFSGKFNV